MCAKGGEEVCEEGSVCRHVGWGKGDWEVCSDRELGSLESAARFTIVKTA